MLKLRHGPSQSQELIMDPDILSKIAEKRHADTQKRAIMKVASASTAQLVQVASPQRQATPKRSLQLPKPDSKAKKWKQASPRNWHPCQWRNICSLHRRASRIFDYGRKYTEGCQKTRTTLSIFLYKIRRNKQCMRISVSFTRTVKTLMAGAWASSNGFLSHYAQSFSTNDLSQ